MSNQIIADQMTSKDRLEAFYSGKPYDRIPCNAFIGEHAAKVLGISVRDYHYFPELTARAQIAAQKLYGSDGVGVSVGLTGMPEALGSIVEYPLESTPYVSKHAIDGYSDLDKLEIPDPRKNGRLSTVLKATEILIEESKGEVNVSCGVCGAFSSAGNLRGAEKLMKDIYVNPQFVHKLLRIVTDSTIAFIKEAGKFKGVSIGIAEPTASGSLISAKQFREFVLPYLTDITDAIKSVGAPAPQLHICGNTKKIWNLMADSGAGALSLDNSIDLEEAKNTVGNRVVIVGNIKPTDTMYLGTPQTVEENVKDNLRKAYNSPKGYILALGCGLPISTSNENVHALVNAARKYGRYPLNPELFN
jgi:uroporphyrinogen decarboxylase